MVTYMLTRASVFTVGIIVGGGLVWALGSLGEGPLGSPEPKMEAAKVVPAALLSCDGEVGPLRARVRELEGRLATVAMTEAVSAWEGEALLAESSTLEGPDAEAKRRQEAVKWRVSAIEKFVPLTEAQRDRLAEKFKREAEAGGEEVDTEKLEDILGSESAEYYRQQVKAAFQRVQDQEVEKEVVWVSRQLSLSPEQERLVQSAYSSVEQQVQQEFGGQEHGGTPHSAQERIKRMVQENRRRNQLLNSQMKAILSSEQYRAFLQGQAEAASSDVEVFHDPG